MPTTENIWTPARIRAKILSSDIMLERSISKIYSRQTTSEQNAGVTVENNKVGFTAFDAEFLSSLALQLQNDTRRPQGQRLSESQRAIARRKMTKYAKQLARMLDEEYARNDTYMNGRRAGIDMTQMRRADEMSRECPDCNGTGNALDEQHTCHRCHGTGIAL